MNGEALGVIEVIGMAAAIEAADTCVKSANVELIGYELTKGSGLVTVKIKGNVGAVKAAIEAAKVSSSRVNKVYASIVIPRPAKSLDSIIESDMTVGIEINKSEVKEEVKENVKRDIESNVEDTHECDSENAQQFESISLKDNNEDNDNKDSDNQDNNENNDNEYNNNEDSGNEHNNDDNKEEPELIENKSNDDICNICHDPKCPRRKGQSRSLCIHHNEI